MTSPSLTSICFYKTFISKGTYIRHEFACQPQVVVNDIEFILPQVLRLVEVVGAPAIDDIHQLVISIEVDIEVLLLVLEIRFLLRLSLVNLGPLDIDISYFSFHNDVY